MYVCAESSRRVLLQRVISSTPLSMPENWLWRDKPLGLP